MSENDNRLYELGYLIVPTTPEAEVPAAVEALKAALAAVEGTVVSEGTPDFIDLAYQIEKNVKSKKMKWTQGYFGWIKFTAAPETLEALKKALDGNLDLMRYMLIKTDAENNVVFKAPKIEAKQSDVSFDEAELSAVADEMDTEEADLKEKHEKLPDVEGDMTVEAPSATVAE
ncbi:MAG: 30S ribosomal protein S6 [Patescibacteria group bacterium]